MLYNNPEHRQISTEELAVFVLAAETIEQTFKGLPPEIVMEYIPHYKILLENIEIGRKQHDEVLRQRDAQIGPRYASQTEYPRTAPYRSGWFDEEQTEINNAMRLFRKRQRPDEDEIDR